jgi:threonine dehydratase
VVGVQSEASPALHAARQAGGLVRVEVRPSLADGLAGNVEPGSITFDLVRRFVAEMLLVRERSIAQAMRWLLERERVLVEGSAAVGVAALLGGYRPSAPVAVVLTGRNVAASVLQRSVFADTTA